MSEKFKKKIEKLKIYKNNNIIMIIIFENNEKVNFFHKKIFFSQKIKKTLILFCLRVFFEFLKQNIKIYEFL